MSCFQAMQAVETGKVLGEERPGWICVVVVRQVPKTPVASRDFDKHPASECTPFNLHHFHMFSLLQKIPGGKQTNRTEVYQISRVVIRESAVKKNQKGYSTNLPSQKSLRMRWLVRLRKRENVPCCFGGFNGVSFLESSFLPPHSLIPAHHLPLLLSSRQIVFSSTQANNGPHQGMHPFLLSHIIHSAPVCSPLLTLCSSFISFFTANRPQIYRRSVLPHNVTF